MMELSKECHDAMAELLNIGVGKAACVLNQMIDMHVSLSVPTVRVLGQQDLLKAFDVGVEEQLASVCLEYGGGFSGATSLVFTATCAASLVDALTGETTSTPGDMDSIRVGTLIEVGNIMINGVMGSMANTLDTNIDYQVPSYSEGTIRELINDTGATTNRHLVLAKTILVIEELRITGDILLCLELGAFSELVTELVNAA